MNSDRRFQLEEISAKMEDTCKSVVYIENFLKKDSLQSRSKSYHLLNQIKFLARQSRWLDVDRIERIDKRIIELARYGRVSEPADSLRPMELERIAAELSRTTLAAANIAAEQKVLRSLHYPRLNDRHAKIELAHEETFSWILDRHVEGGGKCRDVKFLDWLESASGTYWISGKAGSGKSTLMKYLSSHETTMTALRAWATMQSHSLLVTGSFYFWNSGNEMQKSQRGLFQSLLLTIFQKCPHLMPLVCPSRWLSVQSGFEQLETWDVQELFNAIKCIISQLSKSTHNVKCCFFIDGLDEYEGNHYDIVKALSVLTSSSDVKVCLSSRPWSIFEDAFEKTTDRKLYLQDLTQNDIRSYVENNLRKHQSFEISMPEEQEKYNEIIEETVSKSKGVFLWVVLVVRSLYEGLTNGDSIHILQQRLHSFPSDLEDFFRHMLDSVDNVYQHDMARTFQVALQATDSLPLIAYSYADETALEYVLDLPVGPISTNELNSRLDKMRRRINSRTKGLLEICGNSTSVGELGDWVEFLHRTVRDFLLTKDIQRMMGDRMDKGFSPNRAISRAYLALMKTLKVRLVEQMLQHAYLAELESEEADTYTLNELERTMKHPWHRSHLPVETRSVSPLHVEGTGPRLECFTAIDLAVTYGLRLYLEDRLRVAPRIVESSRLPLLEFTLQIRHENGDVPKIATILLQNGADPNYIDPTSFYLRPAWFNWLVSIIKAYQQDDLHSLRLQTLETVLHFRADPNLQSSQSTPWDSALVSIYNLRRHHKSAAQTKYLFEILDLLLCHGAATSSKADHSESVMTSASKHSHGSWSEFERTHPSPQLLIKKVFNSFPPSLSARLQARITYDENDSDRMSHSIRSVTTSMRSILDGPALSIAETEGSTQKATKRGCGCAALFGFFMKNFRRKSRVQQEVSS